MRWTPAPPLPPVLLMAGLATRLGRCQGHRGRASEVARFQQEQGLITAANLGGCRGPVPIRDFKDLQGKEGVRCAELW